MLSRITGCPLIFFSASEHSRNVENTDFCNRTKWSRMFYGGLMQAININKCRLKSFSFFL
jgi:hypothetical protein